MRRFFFSILTVFLLTGTFAAAQVMPPPHRMPRTPVMREPLPSSKPRLPPSREIEGAATVIDGESLDVHGLKLRLFGIVVPQLSASYGPQSREALDAMADGRDLRCHIRDRDTDGRYLATCDSANGEDLALGLLQRGLAVAARGSLDGTDLDASYLQAENAAENRQLGLWSVSVPAAAMTPGSTSSAAARIASNPPPPAPAELKAGDNIANVASATEKPVHSVTVPVAPPDVISLGPGSPAAAASPPANLAEGVMAALPVDALGLPAANAAGGAHENFLMRYQLLVTAFVMLATAIGILIVIGINRRRDRREEMKALAAALRGELLAARALCAARLKSWGEAEDRNAAWPRIRTSLYQAYVGRIGRLGATLARQIASIYGQSSDYGAYYNSAGDEAQTGTPSKRLALQALIKHIEEVLPRLAAIEASGRRLAAEPEAPPPSTALAMRGETAPAAAAPGGTAPMPGHGPGQPGPAATLGAIVASLWDRARDFAQGLLAARAAGWPSPRGAEGTDPHMPDYSVLLEDEDIENMSFGGEEDTTPESEPPAAPSNVTKLRGTGAT